MALIRLHAPCARDVKQKSQINTAVNPAQKEFFESRRRSGIVTRCFSPLMFGLSEIDTNGHCVEFALAVERRQ
jgi:hypothetical protein